MPLTYFTVVADFKSVTADLPTDPTYDPEVGGHLTGNVTFTPLVTKGDVLVVQGVAYIPAPITAVIAPDGAVVLRTVPDPGGAGTYAPVRLLAHSDMLGLAHNLAYEVTFTDIRLDNVPWQITGFTFNAPTGGLLNLASVMPVAGQRATQQFTVDWSQITNKPANL